MLDSGAPAAETEMSQETLAINLSTNPVPRITTRENGETEHSLDSGKICDGNGAVPDSQIMMVPHQVQMQQILSPSQIQQLLQQQALYFQRQQQHHEQQLKQLESVIPHLQEQIQINMIQQNQVLQKLANFPMEISSEKGGRQQLKAQLQQLSLQQHQLIQQLQQSHRQYMLNTHPYNPSIQDEKSDRNSMPWKDGENFIPNGQHRSPTASSSEFEKNENGQTASPSVTPPSSATPKDEHSLYGHGVCKWPGCEVVCEDYQSFVKHLNVEHQLDDRNTAQARVQMQVVNQLQMQLEKEKSRLQAMMDHLHMKTSAKVKMEHVNMNSKSPKLASYPLSRYSPTNFRPSSNRLPVSMSSSLLNLPSRLSPTPNVRKKYEKNYSGHDHLGYPEVPIRRRAAERVNLDITEEIMRNREFYKNADVRPPFTYASLIRQAIIESPERQLTLNEIYNWFQNTFCYFRRNAATWKNAIRTNLSLHKCFVRYEDDFGSFWMVDDCEFVNRRHLSRGRPRKFPESNENFPVSQSLTLNSQQKCQSLSNCSKAYSDPIYTGSQNTLMDGLSSLISNSPITDTDVKALAAISRQTLSSTLPSHGLSEAENLVHNLVCHGLEMSANHHSREIVVKQEPPSELSEQCLLEEPNCSEEAEDLSQGSPCLVKESANLGTSISMPTLI